MYFYFYHLLGGVLHALSATFARVRLALSPSRSHRACRPAVHDSREARRPARTFLDRCPHPPTAGGGNTDSERTPLSRRTWETPRRGFFLLILQTACGACFLLRVHIARPGPGAAECARVPLEARESNAAAVVCPHSPKIPQKCAKPKSPPLLGALLSPATAASSHIEKPQGVTMQWHRRCSRTSREPELSAPRLAKADVRGIPKLRLRRATLAEPRPRALWPASRVRGRRRSALGGTMQGREREIAGLRRRAAQGRQDGGLTAGMAARPRLYLKIRVGVSRPLLIWDLSASLHPWHSMLLSCYSPRLLFSVLLTPVNQVDIHRA